MRQSHSNGTTWLVLLVLGGIGCGKEENDLLAAIENRGVLRMASDPAYPPQSSLEDGVWKGFDISVGEEIARRIGVKLEPMPSDWQEVTSGNWGERWDISVGSMTDTLTRESVLYFAKPPYHRDVKSFFSAADHHGYPSLFQTKSAPPSLWVLTPFVRKRSQHPKGRRQDISRFLVLPDFWSPATSGVDESGFSNLSH